MQNMEGNDDFDDDDGDDEMPGKKKKKKKGKKAAPKKKGKKKKDRDITSHRYPCLGAFVKVMVSSCHAWYNYNCFFHIIIVMIFKIFM